MLLHDIVTIFLFVGYLFGYMHSIGTLIIFVHDLTDIPFQIAKAINTTVLHELAIYPFILGQLMWVYFRLFCLPLMIYELLQVEYASEYAQFQPFVRLNAVFLSMLVCMHILWFYMFMRLNLAHYRNYKNLDEVMHIGGVTPPSDSSSSTSAAADHQD